MKIKPTEKQLSFLDWEIGVFFHFGIRSFYPGHSDWDGLEMPLDLFNPDALNCEQWIRTAKQAGATYTILVCKHHDGFANWPTKYSDYSIASTPWKDGKGDVVREYVDACRKYDMKVGLYYSPAQWQGSVSFENQKAYDDYFVNQISELLTNYGKIDYLWFDACGSEKHEYDKTRIIHTIRSLQPDILIFSMWDPDSKWVGNEDGYAPMLNWNTVKSLDFSMLQEQKQELQTDHFLPSECDCKLRSTWFDCELNEDTIKSVEQLIGMYEMSVGRGANFLINIGPNCHGVLYDSDVARMLEFRKELDRRYADSLPFSELAADEKNPDTFVARLADWTENSQEQTNNVLVDTVILEEDLTEGQSIQEFRIYANLPCYRSKRICLYHGDTIGHKLICRFPTMCTGQISIEILKHDGTYRLKSFSAYYTQKH